MQGLHLDFYSIIIIQKSEDVRNMMLKLKISNIYAIIIL